MLNLVYCEFLKLNRSKMVMLSVLGVFSTPILMFLEAIQTHFKEPETIFTLEDIFDSSLLYMMLLTNIMIYITITAYLFSREYGECTLKTILPLPVSRVKFIFGKFLVLFFWITMLTIITWLGIFILSLLYHGLFGLEGVSFELAIKWLIKFLYGSILMFLTISPFAYIAEKSKGFVAPVITSAVVVMGSAALSNQDLGAIYPWTASFFIVKGDLLNTGYSSFLVFSIIILESICGFFATFQYFLREDIGS